jgi:hypothetical protein
MRETEPRTSAMCSFNDGLFGQIGDAGLDGLIGSFQPQAGLRSAFVQSSGSTARIGEERNGRSATSAAVSHSRYAFGLVLGETASPRNTSTA